MELFFKVFQFPDYFKFATVSACDKFWQSQKPEVIFKAVEEMIKDYLLIRGKSVDKFRLQRTVEYFEKLKEAEKLKGDSI